MDALYSLVSFYPAGTTDEQLDQYIEHHIASVVKCVDNELFSSAYSHLHLLYMVFIYVQLLRIAKEKEQEFEYGWIGFPGQEKDFLKKPTSPFSFSPVQERTVFRFFRLVGFDDGSIGNISSVVDTRNKRLHASGQLHCATIDEFESELNGYTDKMRSIVEKQAAFLNNIYEELLELYDEGYEFTADDLESNFIDQYLFSEYELALIAKGKNDLASKFIQANYP